MKLEDAINLVSESNGSHLYDIFIPSAGRDVKFKPISTGQQKTLSKFSMNAKVFNLGYEIVKLSIFDELVQDDTISSIDLTEVDMVAFFAGVRLNNVSDPLEINFTCGSCGHQFLYEMEMDKILERCSKFKKSEFDFSFDANDMHYDLVISEPSYQNLIELEEYVRQMSEQMNMADKELIEYRAFNKPAVYIKEVKINGNAIDDFEHADFIDKLKLYNSLPPKITFNGKNCILNLILDEFDLDASTNMTGEVYCTYKKCGKKLEDVLTNDSFFII